MGRGKDKHSFFNFSSERKAQSSKFLIHKAVKFRAISWETLPVEMELVWIYIEQS